MLLCVKGVVKGMTLTRDEDGKTFKLANLCIPPYIDNHEYYQLKETKFGYDVIRRVKV